MVYDVAIIGAGASGLMCASHIHGKKVAIIEANKKIGLKILASGGGKCNVTNKNISSAHYQGDSSLIEAVFSTYGNKELLAFLGRFDLALEQRKYGQLFCKNSAKDITDIFKKTTQHCKYFLDHKVHSVQKANSFSICTDKCDIQAKKVIIASGGLSYAPLGASGIGYEIAKSFGHSICTPHPALVGFTVQKDEFWMKNLSGISLHVALRVGEKKLASELLFTHKGISGPVVLSGSLYWEKGKITLDFLPDVSLSNLFKKAGKKQLSSILPLPKRFTLAFLQKIGLQDKAIYKLTEAEKSALEQIHAYSFAPAGNFGYTKAEVTKGGVDTSEIEPLSFESKIQKDLYFIGEVLDVTGELGGYNFQWAFSSAFCLAKNLT